MLNLKILNLNEENFQKVFILSNIGTFYQSVFAIEYILLIILFNSIFFDDFYHYFELNFDYYDYII